MADISSGNIFKDAIAGYGQTTDAVRDRVGTERATGQERLQGTTEAALGMIDEQAFLAQHPEFQEGYDREKAKGTNVTNWLEDAIRAASYIKPGDVPRSGGIVDTVGAVAGKLGGIENAANTAARAAGAADVTALSPQLAAAYRANNAELFGALGKAGGMVDSGDPYAAYRASVLGQQAVGPAATQGYGASLAASQGYGATNAMSQGYASTDATSQGYTAEQAATREYQAAQARAVQEAQAQMIRQGQLGQSLYGQALGAGASGAAQMLGQRAQQFAGSTGQLSQEELRSVQQGSREAFAARGLEMSNPAISGEIGARIAAQRARQSEDLQMAAGLNQAYTQDLTANRGFATGLYGQDVSLQAQNQGAALQAALAKQQAGITLSLADQQAINSASQFGANAANEQARYNAQAVNAANQFGASAANQASLYNAQLRSAASQFGASAANQASLQNAQSANVANQFTAAAGNLASITNAGAVNDASKFSANAANLGAQFNQELEAKERQRQIDNLSILGKNTLGQTESNRNYQMDVTGGYQNAVYDPTSLILGKQSNALANSSGVYNAAAGTNPDFSDQLKLTTGVATDANMTAFNAAEAARLADKNNRAAITGAVIGAVGGVAGSYAGRPPKT